MCPAATFAAMAEELKAIRCNLRTTTTKTIVHDDYKRRYDEDALWDHVQNANEYIEWRRNLPSDASIEDVVDYLCKNWSARIPCGLWANIMAQYWSNKYHEHYDYGL